MKLTFLSADRPLTKTHILQQDGSYESTSYPMSAAFSSHEEHVSTIEEFYEVLVKHAAEGHCLLKGNLQRPLVRESRAGLTASEATQFLCTDFDSFDLGSKSIDAVISELGFSDTDYILQYSASHGIKPGLRAHVIFLLDRPYAPEQIKQFLKWRNLFTPWIRDQIELTATNLSLRWPLDISVADNSRILYIAPPIIVGAEDPIKERIILVKKGTRKVQIPAPTSDLEASAAALIQQLRSAKGLKERKYVLKHVKGEDVDVLANPERVSVTGVKVDGDYTRVNIGDTRSWGYWHYTDNPNILFNFRGEPNYLLKDIAPDYYRQARSSAKKSKLVAHTPKELNGSPKRWVINHADEGKYYKVSYSPQLGLDLTPAPTLKHVEDWCVLEKIPIPETIQDWKVEFNPTRHSVIDSDKRTINLYKPTPYRVNSVNEPQYSSALNEDSDDIPEEYRLLIKHVCGGDEEATARFINWLAYIWQTGKRPKTAWIFHGTYGTGKGRLLKVLKALFGQHCISTGPEGLEDKFNDHLEKAQIVWLDEITTDSWDTEKMTPKLRALIDGEVALRGMRKGWKNMEPYFGLIIAGNERNLIEIRFKDRRFNVAPRQEQQLADADWVYDEFELFDDEFGKIYQPENIQLFANALMSYPVDIVKVRKPLQNEAKEAIMRVTQNLPDDIVQSLQTGNVSFFLEFVPTTEVPPNIETATYKAFVQKIMRGGQVPLSVTELSGIFEFLAGWKQSPGKFNKAVSKYGIDLRNKRIRENGKVYPGVYFTFYPTEADKSFWTKLHETKLEVVREARSE